MFRRPGYIPLFGVLATCLLTACPAPADMGSEAVESRDLPVESYGIVRATARSPRTLDQNEPAVSVDAHFFEMSAIEPHDVTRALELWTPVMRDEGCRVYETPRPTVDRQITIRGLHAGLVSWSGMDQDAVSLEPRELPQYDPQFTGVIYGTDRPVYRDLNTDVPFTFWNSGDTDIGRFVVELDAPPSVRLTWINGRVLGSATQVRVGEDDPVEVAFATEAADVFLTLRGVGSATLPSVECRFSQADTIRFDADELTDVFGTVPIELVVRTVHHSALSDEPGEMPGDVVFEYFDRIEIRRQPE